MTSERRSSLDCKAVWDPVWAQATSNEWWAEYIITGGKVESASLEIGDRLRVTMPLAGQWGSKWSVGVPNLAAGTPVVLHARNSLGQSASSYPFGYLSAEPPQTDPCGGACTPHCGAAVCGDDGCGGSCGRCSEGDRCDDGACVQAPQRICSGGTCSCLAPWNPSWQQLNANNWWVEYTISRGTVASAWVEIVGGDRFALSWDSGRWVGSPPTGIPTGAQVVLHARDATGRTAQTAPFAYLTTTALSTDACWGSGPPPSCGDLPAGMVSINFDDGFDVQYTLAREKLLAHHMRATLYLISEALQEGWPGYITLPHVQALMQDGNEIGSHTVDHQNLAAMGIGNVEEELWFSKQYLETNLGIAITQFASPYGAYNAGVISSARRYYQTHTTVEMGLNFPGDDLYRLKRVTVTADMTPEYLNGLIQQAASSRGWLILVFHNLSPEAATGFQTGHTLAAQPDAYTYRISDFGTVLDDIAASGLEVVDVSHGAARLGCR